MGARKSKLFTVIAAAMSFVLVSAATCLCAVFPNKFSREIQTAALKFGLDGTLVRSVVWAESKFDKNAVSPKGALGLMQLMPDTFDACANALGMIDADPFDPQTSLDCGCFYLSVLMDKFDGDTQHALMAYNAGEANAKRFASGEPVFHETESYLKNIGLAKKYYSIFIH